MNERYPFENTPLPYPYDAMEPYIGTETMHLHHDKHLQGYINNLNKALKDCPPLQHLTLEELILNACRFPGTVQVPIMHNAGGVYNHRFFFQGLKSADPAGTEPAGPLGDAVRAGFGSFGQFEQDFKQAALSVFGSGYAWLAVDRRGRLVIFTTPNQNTPLTENLCPVLNIDVWEHAYYLNYQNRRSDYIDAWFHVVDWERAGLRYAQCMQTLRGCRR